jgi:hypothetical protein
MRLLQPEEPSAHVTELWWFAVVFYPHVTSHQDQRRQKLNCFTELLMTWKRTTLGFVRLLAIGASNKTNNSLQSSRYSNL